MSGYEEYRDSGIPWMGEVPSHWQSLKLKHFLEEKRKTANPSLEAGSISFGSVVYKNAESLAAETKASYQEVLPGEFLVNPLNLNFDLKSLRTALSGIEVVVSTGYIVLRSKQLAKRYVRWLLHEFDVAHMKTLGSGVRQTINYTDIGNSVFCKPSFDEQTQIARFLDFETARIDALIEKQQDLIALLKEKRQAVISHAVTKGLNPSAPLRDSGVEWLGMVPAHWEVRPLHRIVDQKRQVMYGIVLPGPDVAEGVPIVKGGDVKLERLNLASLNKTTAAIESKYARSRLRGGDLVYAIRGGVGDVELVPEEISGANVTQDAARIAPGRGVSAEWLLMSLRGNYFWRQIERRITGATVRGINIYDLKRGFVAVPPKDEQLAIAAFLKYRLGRIEELHHRSRILLDLLQERRTALISAAVTGKIDVRGWKPPDARAEEQEVA